MPAVFWECVSAVSWLLTATSHNMAGMHLCQLCHIEKLQKRFGLVLVQTEKDYIICLWTDTLLGLKSRRHTECKSTANTIANSQDSEVKDVHN